MDLWPCSVCAFIAEGVRDLVHHLEALHDDWLDTRQLPPVGP